MKQRPPVFDDRPAQRLKLSEQEQQLIAVIRENAADDAGHRSIQTTQRYIDGDSNAQRKLVAMI